MRRLSFALSVPSAGPSKAASLAFVKDFPFLGGRLFKDDKQNGDI